MSNISVCRLCLVDNGNMCEILNTPLQEIYERLTDILLKEDDGKPHLACYVCYALLEKCRVFKEACLTANDVLTQKLDDLKSTHEFLLIGSKRHKFIQRLCLSHPEVFIAIPSQYDVKYEADGNDGIKVEMIDNGNVDSDFSYKDEQSKSDINKSDSEDDIPLKQFSLKKIDNMKRINVKVRKKHVRIEKEIKKEKELKVSGFNSEYIKKLILTKEQQIEELKERSKSLNYLNSPYKCDLCYKGFIDLLAYYNHKEKHEESNGIHECEICRLRYGSRRQLRAHKAMSHTCRYQCLRCRQITHTANQAREHEKWHQGHIYECKLCAQKFRKSTSYLTHMRKRHPSEHVCETCGDTFVGKHGLMMHKTKSHKRDEKQSNSSEPPSKRYCSECKIQFLNINAWKRHMITSLKHSLQYQTSGECSICGASCSSGEWATHARRHARELRPAPRAAGGSAPRLHLATVDCDECGAQFVTKASLKSHKNRIHLGLKYNKNIVCEVCGKKCTSNAVLRYHQRTHTGERPYSCSSCVKRFPDKNQLRIHIRTHTGEKPYCCGVCGKKFSQKPALNRHYRVHTGAKPYECQYCSKAFSQTGSLKLHVKTIHLKQPTSRRNKSKQDDKEKAQDVMLQIS